MAEPEKVSFKITENLFKQLADWQENIEEADRLAEENPAENSPQDRSQDENYGRPSPSNPKNL